MRQLRRFGAGLGAFTPYEAAGRLVTIGLCLLVGAGSGANLVQDAPTLLSAGVLGVCLVVVLSLFAIVVRAGEPQPF